MKKKHLLKLAGGKQIEINNKKLDLQTQVILKLSENYKQYNEMNPKKAHIKSHENNILLGIKNVKLKKIENINIPANKYNIPCRIYTPENVNDITLIYYHGGGHVIGSVDSHENISRYISKKLQCKVIAVEYRLAPEHKFPAAVEDAYNSYKWIIKNPKDLNINPKKIILIGDSAGGNLATVVCQLAVKENIILPCYQLLIYPMIDFNTQCKSHNIYAKGFGLTKDMIQWFINHYINNSNDKNNHMASPILFKNLKKLPPAIVITASFDPLHDEGKLYAEKLRKSGVKTIYYDFSDMIHGFFGLAGVVKSAEKAFNKTLSILEEELKKI